MNFKQQVLSGLRQRRGGGRRVSYASTVAEANQRFQSTMQPLSDDDRVNRAKLIVSDPQEDPLSTAYAQKMVDYAEAQSRVAKHQAELAALDHELATDRMGRSYEAHGRLMESRDKIERAIQDAMIAAMSAAERDLTDAHSKAVDYFTEKQAKADHEAATAAALDKARADIAAEQMATRAREIAEAEAKAQGTI